MKPFLTHVLLLLILVVPEALFAGIIKGKVTDNKGEALPFATILVQGTTIGTSANAEGQYQLSLSPGEHKVVCQYMGYKQGVYNITISGSETINHDFSLAEQTLEMNTVTIKANSEDPAYAIMRKVIARRSFHAQQVKSLQTGVYLKGVLRNRAMPDEIFGIKITDESGSKSEASRELGLDSSGKGILYLVEEKADYYSNGDKTKTIIRSVKQSGNPRGVGFSQIPSVISFYDNNINLFEGFNPRGFVSPVSDNALHYYKYKYEGEFRQDGYVVDKIKVTPKRLYEPLFEGTIYIAEEDWTIYSLDMTVTQKNNLEFLDTIRINQTHVPLKKDTWVIKSQVFYPTINFLGLDMAGYFLTVYDNQKINEAVPDRVFKGNVIGSYDSMATKRDSAYWTVTRPIPLEADEIKDYTVKDSIRIVQEDPAYKDSVRRAGNSVSPLRLITGGINYYSKEYRHHIYTNSAISLRNGLINYNTVEGLNVSPKIYWDYIGKDKSEIKTALATRYGFNNKHFNAIGRVAYRRNDTTWNDRYWELGIEGGKYVFQFNPNAISPLYNTFSTLVYGQNFMKIYERWTGAVFFERSYGNGFSWDAKLSFQRRLPLDNTTTYNWSGKKDDVITSNTPAELSAYPWEIHNAALVHIGLAYRPGTRYIQYPDFKQPVGSNWPLFRLVYEKGIPDVLKSKTDFDKWYFGIEDDVRLKLAGTLSYNLTIGGFFNKKYVSLPDLKHLNDNQVIIASSYMRSFQLAPYYRYSNAENLYGELHLEYYLKGLLTNKIPLLRQAKWYLVLGTNTFYAGTNNYYTEAFAGIDNLGYKWARFLRVDFIRSWDNLKRTNAGIRVGLKLGNFIHVSDDANDKGDW